MQKQPDFSKDYIKCPYQRGVSNPAENPHISVPWQQPPKICETALDAIGNTPLIRLNKVPQSYGVKAQILIKCEFQNIGGSVKDRIAKRMVLDAEKQGRIKPGDTLVEATSGNTGVGLCIASIVRGFKMRATLPDKMSQEKQDIMEGLNAEVVRTPAEAPYFSDESHFGVSRKMVAEDPEHTHLLDQYSNPSNPMSHYDGTAEEIMWQTNNDLHAIAIGVGTGGSLTGISRKIHEKLPNVKIIGVDPWGSMLALPLDPVRTKEPFSTEGVGQKYVPQTMSREGCDEWIKVEDRDSFITARRIMKEEGVMIGGSAGMAIYGAILYALKHKDTLTEKDKIVVILPDGIRNYMTKFLSTAWMVENKYLPYQTLEDNNHVLNGRKVKDLNLKAVKPFVVTGATVGDVLNYFNQKDACPLLPLIEKEDSVQLFGVADQNKMLKTIVNRKLKKDDKALALKEKDFVVVPDTIDLSVFERIVERHKAVFVLDENQDLKSLRYGSALDLLNAALQ